MAKLREKKYMVIINFVDGTIANQFVITTNKMTLGKITEQILHSYSEFSINDQSGDPTIKQITIIPLKGDIFEFRDLDIKFNETKQKFIEIKNNTGGIN